MKKAWTVHHSMYEESWYELLAVFDTKEKAITWVVNLINKDEHRPITYDIKRVLEENIVQLNNGDKQYFINPIKFNPS